MNPALYPNPPVDFASKLLLRIREEQVEVFEEQRLRAFADETASTLAKLCLEHSIQPREPIPSMKDFVFGQMGRAEAIGLRRKDELTAFSLCAVVYGGGFEQNLASARAVLADVNYDRATLLAELAMRGLENAGSPS